MKIISAKISNILSIEDTYVEFDSSGLMLVQGWNHDVGRANGAGKTAIFNAITFALYDRLPRKITSTEIVRRGCKSGYVEVVAEIGDDKYLVRRSRPKGAVFSRWVDGVSGLFVPVTMTQEEFESKLRLNYKQFMLSMYAAQGTSERFLSINDTDKKQFLLQLLNLEEFSSCKFIADGKVKGLESELITLLSKIDNLRSKIDAYEESLVVEDVINNHIALSNQQITDLTANLVLTQAVNRPDLSKYQKLEEDITAKKTEFTRVKARREMLYEQYHKIQSKVKPFRSETTCTQCGSILDTSAAEAQHSKLLDSYKNELFGIKSEIYQCDIALLNETSIDNLRIKLRDKKKEESKDYEVASMSTMDIQAKINLKRQELKQLNLKLQNNLELESKIKDLSDTVVIVANSRANKLREIEVYKTVSAMYSATGAQAYILDSVVELFNERITEYVGLLWSNLTYELKSYKETVKGDVTAKFSECLIMDAKPISMGSLSGGEFRALSLCVDFALIDVMERQFGISLSPVILDEPFNDLDPSGRELIIDLLEPLAHHRQVIVIDHASEAQSMFSKVLKVDKKAGISTISLES
jgi:DNA repair exonuclease SbcCD ATPase subunit